MSTKTDYLLYQRLPDSSTQSSPIAHEVTDGLFLRVWEPGFVRAIPFGALDKAGFVINWLLALPSVLIGKGFRYRGCFLCSATGEVIAECVVTEASSRFGFMEPGDLQVGAVLVPVSRRGVGVGKRLLQLVLLDIAGQRRVWWVCRRDNLASVRLAAHGGFGLVGEVVRSVSFGMPRYSSMISGLEP